MEYFQIPGRQVTMPFGIARSLDKVVGTTHPLL